jgi:hypothetical protein
MRGGSAPGKAGTRVATNGRMTLTFDRETAQVLREILESQLRELRVESARADVHAFREKLHRRERIVEELLAELGNAQVRSGNGLAKTG